MQIPDALRHATQTSIDHFHVKFIPSLLNVNFQFRNGLRTSRWRVNLHRHPGPHIFDQVQIGAFRRPFEGIDSVLSHERFCESACVWHRVILLQDDSLIRMKVYVRQDAVTEHLTVAWAIDSLPMGQKKSSHFPKPEKPAQTMTHSLLFPCSMAIFVPVSRVQALMRPSGLSGTTPFHPKRCIGPKSSS